ncbi:MAG: hypothetical protein CBE50_001035 [Flammeovirgaceae bacterium TMED290]|nr:MAG: hypothetical protein CBE50_001035 [Flammeovirgaceae bacterium TMED290]|tara:strand:- start:4629 stop:6017 length:1389 start_codon:yes stop_codon:yes gene_type:complete
MYRYLIIVFLFLASHVIAQQSSYNKSYKKIDLFSKFNEKLTFGLSNSEIKNIFTEALSSYNLNFKDEGYRYFFSVSHGWKKNKNELYRINNFKGLLIDAESKGIIAEFSVSKTNEIEKSIYDIIKNLLILNERLVVKKKFVDISDHFKKMEMNMWDSSRPDSHAPSSLFADHTHSRGGFMFGYKYSNSRNKKIFRGSESVTKDIIFSNYSNAFNSSTYLKHTLEFMYGISDDVTVFSKIDYMDKEISYSDILSKKSKYLSTGFGDLNIQFLYKIIDKNWIRSHTNIGFDIPIGNKKKNMILPYNMFLGKGHFNSVIGFTTFFQFPKISTGFQPIIRFSLNKNSNEFSYGNNYDLYYWVSFKLNKLVSLSYSKSITIENSINGQNLSLVREDNMNLDFQNTGYKILNNSLGINLSPRKGALKNFRFAAEYFIPIYQSFLGFQSSKLNDFVVTLQVSPGGHIGH